jgi:hypothetical protein
VQLSYGEYLDALLLMETPDHVRNAAVVAAQISRDTISEQQQEIARLRSRVGCLEAEIRRRDARIKDKDAALPGMLDEAARAALRCAGGHLSTLLRLIMLSGDLTVNHRGQPLHLQHTLRHPENQNRFNQLIEELVERVRTLTPVTPVCDYCIRPLDTIGRRTCSTCEECGEHFAPSAGCLTEGCSRNPDATTKGAQQL